MHIMFSLITIILVDLMPYLKYMSKGLENKLKDPEELFDIPAEYRSSYIGARMDRALVGNVDHHQQYADIPHEPFISTGTQIKTLLILQLIVLVKDEVKTIIFSGNNMITLEMLD